MTDRKDRADPFTDMGFGETLASLAQTNSKELADAMARVRQAQAEVEKRADEVRENIRQGFRTPGRKLGI
jgi:hypothetical protein